MTPTVASVKPETSLCARRRPCGTTGCTAKSPATDRAADPVMATRAAHVVGRSVNHCPIARSIPSTAGQSNGRSREAFRDRQIDPEGRAHTDLTADRDATLAEFHDTLDDCDSQPGASRGRVPAPVDPVESVKDVQQVPRRYPAARACKVVGRRTVQPFVDTCVALLDATLKRSFRWLFTNFCPPEGAGPIPAAG